MKLRLMVSKNLPNASLPKVPPDRCRLRFPADDNSDRRPLSRHRQLFTVSLANPQVKKLPPSEPTFLDEIFKGCLPADALIRAEPLLWLQRLYLGQLFPALFPTTRKDFPSSGGPRSGKKAVLVTTFSFGRLVCSFHEAWIIVKFVWNIQRFILSR
jgi:hypothetical protein